MADIYDLDMHGRWDATPDELDRANARTVLDLATARTEKAIRDGGNVRRAAELEEEAHMRYLQYPGAAEQLQREAEQMEAG